MIRNLFISACILSLNISANGQATSTPVGARAVAAGYTSLTAENLWASSNNQAATAYFNKFQAGLYFENHYLLDEMNRIAMGVFFPFNKGGISLCVDHFGGSLYSEMKAGLGFALPMGDNFSAGVQLDYMRMAIGEGYDSYHALTFEAGVLARITDDIKIGLHVFNPIHQKWTKTEEHIPVLIRAGIAVRPEKSLELYAEVHKSTSNPAIICGGAEYHFREKFFMRMGITSGPARYTFGVGFSINRIFLDISSSVHSWLGYSPQLSFTYTFSK